MTNGIPANYLVASKCLGLDGKTFREMPESQEYLTENLGYDPKLAKEYYDGNGINEQHTIYRPRTTRVTALLPRMRISLSCTTGVSGEPTR